MVRSYVWQFVPGEDGTLSGDKAFELNNMTGYKYGWRVCYRVCPVCGRLDFMSATDRRSETPDSESIFDITNSILCNDCEDVFRRSPEVFAWVQSVSRMMLEIHVQKCKDTRRLEFMRERAGLPSQRRK